MWSCLLLLFVFFWNNDAIPRFKRGSRSFSTLAVGIVAFVTLFTYAHQDAAFVGSDKQCPGGFDLATWVGINLAVGAVTLLSMFFVALRLGTPREHQLFGYMYANGLDSSQVHGQLKEFTPQGTLVEHDWRRHPKTGRFLVDHLDPIPRTMRVSSLRWLLLAVGICDVVMNCVGIWVLVAGTEAKCHESKRHLFNCVAALVGLFFSLVAVVVLAFVGVTARAAVRRRAAAGQL